METKNSIRKIKMKIRNFLRKRGFERMERNHYANDKCSVNLDDKYISIADNLGDNVIIPVDIYSVVGALIYWEYIEKFDL